MTTDWMRDTWGEANRNALHDEAACLARAADYDGWCPTTGTIAIRIPSLPAAPTTAGCYVFAPNGCDKAQQMTTDWMRDTWGEANRNALHDEAACLARAADYDGWCPTTGTIAIWISSLPAASTTA